jgi:hypothetical protein
MLYLPQHRQSGVGIGAISKKLVGHDGDPDDDCCLYDSVEHESLPCSRPIAAGHSRRRFGPGTDRCRLHRVFILTFDS